MPDQSERLATLVGNIYQAGIEPDRWDAVLADVCDEIGAIGSLMGYYSPSREHGHTAACVRLDPDVLKVYHTHYIDNIWTRNVGRFGPDRTFYLDELVPVRVLKRTAFYADILAPQGIVNHLGANFLGDENGVGGNGFMMGKAADEQSPETLKVASFLNAHVARALELGSRLNAATVRQRAAEEAIDQLRRGVITLESDGSVRFMNAAARAIMAAGDGLKVEKGQLRATNASSDRELAAAVARVLRTQSGLLARPGGVFTIRRPSGLRPYLMTLMPFRSETLWPPATRPAVLCFITDQSGEHRACAGVLTHLYGLTPTETRIAIEIADGHSLPQAARICGVRPTTARTHLQSVFDKTGTRSQVALAQLITQIVRSLPMDQMQP